MDSSNMGVETTGVGDIEAQQPNRSWFATHKHMLRPNQEAEVNKLGYFILKVPKNVRQPPSVFSPIEWQFGLHNRENLDNNGSEAIKLGVAQQYGLVGEKWDPFCDAIVDDPKAMLTCYGLQDGMNSWTNEEIKHLLALDALFLAFYIDKCLPQNFSRLSPECNMMSSQLDRDNVFHTRYENWIFGIHKDLYRVENQVPLILVNKVVDYLIHHIPSLTSKDNESNIDDLQYKQRSVGILILILADCFIDIYGEGFQSETPSAIHVKTHIFGAIYDFICGSKDSSRSNELESTRIHILSATKLDQSGIKIVGVNEPLCRMSYKKKCLSLPKMKMYDHTPTYIRNMVYYEVKNNLVSCVFSDYILFMLDLIKAPEDVDLLTECGVIENGCGMRTFGMWKALDEGLPIGSTSIECNVIRNNISSRCKHRKYRFWSEFQIVFCSRPWLVLSTIVVVLVTVATLVQTYISIIGSNKMKPKFP